MLSIQAKALTFKVKWNLEKMYSKIHLTCNTFDFMSEFYWATMKTVAILLFRCSMPISQSKLFCYRFFCGNQISFIGYSIYLMFYVNKSTAPHTAYQTNGWVIVVYRNTNKSMHTHAHTQKTIQTTHLENIYQLGLDLRARDKHNSIELLFYVVRSVRSCVLVNFIAEVWEIELGYIAHHSMCEYFTFDVCV